MGKELDIEKKTNLRRLEGNSKTSATLKGLGCSSAGMASDRHAADTGSIPRCGKGVVLSESTFNRTQTLLRCPYTSVCNRVH